MKYLPMLLSAGLLACALPAQAASVADFPDAVTKVDEPPVPVKMQAPDYPRTMRAAQTSGMVTMNVIVGEAGEVLAAEVTKSTHDDFNPAALAAVARWKFKPATVSGKPVKVRIAIPVRFSVND